MIAALAIRSALQEDFAPLCALYCQSVKCYPDGFIQDLTFHGCLIEKSHRWREARGDIAVALLNEKVVGLGGLAPCGENRVELCKLHVSPDCHGLGIGRALTEHLIAQARTTG